MSHTVNTLFKIESIDQENGQIVIRFINPYGVIETGQKTYEDFEVTEQVYTGEKDSDGNRITKPHTYMSDPNPNRDIILNYDIPLYDDKTFYNKNDLLEWIAKLYPASTFEDMNTRNSANPISELDDLVGSEHNINVVYETNSNVQPTPQTNDLGVEYEYI